MKKLILLKIIIILSLFLMQSTYCQSEEDVDIKSVSSTLDRYRTSQKVDLHLKLAKIYAKNADWEDFYKHLTKVYEACPELRKRKMMLALPETTGEPLTDKDIVSPKILKKLAKLDLKQLNTRQKAMQFTELLGTVCEKICKVPK